MQFKDSEDKFKKISDLAYDVKLFANYIKTNSDKAGVAYACGHEQLTDIYLDDSLNYINKLEEVIKKFKEENNGNK